MCEAYGQTECSGIMTFVSMVDPTNGHVGGVNTCCECMLEDVPDMNYFHTDHDANGNLSPRGEILIRGTNVTPGYYKNEAKTAETITNVDPVTGMGWLHTGDIG